MLEENSQSAFTALILSIGADKSSLDNLFVPDLTNELVVEQRRAAQGATAYIHIATWRQSVKVAVKQNIKYLLDTETRSGTRETINQEIKFLAKLRHPRIIPLLGTAVLDGIECMITPWMQNGHIGDYLTKQPNADRLNLIRDIASGAVYLHENGTVHGDIKPHNCLIDGSGRAILTDFGQSKEVNVANAGQRETSSTIHFAPPEVFIGKEHLEGNPHRKTMAYDVWSFGMTCYSIVSGELPFYAIRTPMEVIPAIVKGKTPHKEHIFDQYEQLWRLLQKCWRMIPEERPKMHEIFAALQNESGVEDLSLFPRLENDQQVAFEAPPSYDETFASDIAGPSTLRSYENFLVIPQYNANGILVHLPLFQKHYDVTVEHILVTGKKSVKFIIKGKKGQVDAAYGELEKVVQCQNLFGTNVCHPTARGDPYTQEDFEESEEVIEDYNGREDF